MTSDKLRFAVIGTGFGTIVHIPAIQDCTGAEVTVVCSGQEERARATAERFGIPRWTTDYRDAVASAEVDAVAVVTPVYLHYPMVMAALKAGKHVLCEKPMALNAGQCREMLQAAEARGLVHMICHEFRWHPVRAHMARLIQDGYVGQIRHINMSLYVPARGGSLGSPYYNWAAQRSMGGGMLMAIGSHYIDALRVWMGEFSGAFGRLYTHGPERLHPDTGEAVLADADDAYTFILDRPDGSWATMSASMAAPFGSGARIEVYGSEGALVTAYPSFNPRPADVLLGARVGEPALHELPVPAELRPFDDDRDDRMMPFRLLLERFVAGVRSGKAEAPSFHDGLKVQELLDAVVAASDTGQKQAVQEMASDL